jgi:cytochrome c-type biogenesis protein
MFIVFISFVAGVLTIFSPCVFTLLPVILAGSTTAKSRLRPVIISLSLAFSVIIFTLLLRISTLFIGIEQTWWNAISGLLLISLGVFTLFPRIWNRLASLLNISDKSNILLQKSSNLTKFWEPVATGFALGPVFNSCSPTYLFLVSTVVAQDLTTGILGVVSYSLGLGFILLLIGFSGQVFVSRFKFLANPNNRYKKLLGLIFIFLGIVIFLGFDKSLEAGFLSWIQQDANNPLNRLLEFEQNLLP